MKRLPPLCWQACGSGGTTAGLALGFHLAGAGLRLHSYGVCDSPDIFYDDIQQLFAGLGAEPTIVGASSQLPLSFEQDAGVRSRVRRPCCAMCAPWSSGSSH